MLLAAVGAGKQGDRMHHLMTGGMTGAAQRRFARRCERRLKANPLSCQSHFGALHQGGQVDFLAFPTMPNCFYSDALATQQGRAEGVKKQLLINKLRSRRAACDAYADLFRVPLGRAGIPASVVETSGEGNLF